jgi:hypothetical protein
MKFGERAFLGIQATRQRLLKKERDAAARQLDKDMRKLGKQWKKDLIRGCTQQEEYHVVREDLQPNKSAKRRFQQIKLMDPLYSETEMWFRVITEGGKLPFGVSIATLLKPEFAINLGASVQRTVRVEYDLKDPSKGLWFVVEIDGSMRGVPLELTFNKAFDLIPESRSPLTVVLGAIQGGHIELIDLEDGPHWILAGSTGYGKSNMLNQIIVTILRRNKPEDVQMYLFDLKSGVELKPYKDLPHVVKFVKRKEDVLGALQEIRALVDERLALFEAKNKKKLRDWNATQKEKLPIVLVLFDELATILLDKDYKTDVETALSDLGAISRATGVNIVFCTQRPSTDVVTGLLKVNFDGRIAFAVPTVYDSRTVLDEGGAENLRGYQGRAMMIRRGFPIEAQTPLLTDEVRDDHLRIIRSQYHLPGENAPQVTISDLLLYSLENLDGKLPYRVLLDEFKPMGMTEPRLFAMINEASERGIVLHGKLYKIVKSKGRAGTRIVPVRQSALRTLIKGRKNADETEAEKMTA